MAKTKVKKEEIDDFIENQGKLTLAKIYVSGYKKLECVEITPKATGVTRIVAENKNGKSSLIESIMQALGGSKKVKNFSTTFINEKVGKIFTKLEFNDGTIVERSLDNDGVSVLKAYNGDKNFDAKYVMSLFSEIAFNKDEVVGKRGLELQTYIKNILDIDTTSEDIQIKDLLEKRKELNYKYKGIEFKGLEPVERINVDVSDLDKEKEKIEHEQKKLGDIDQKISTIDRRIRTEQRDIDSAKSRRREIDEEIEALERKIKRLQNEQKEEEVKENECKSNINKLEEEKVEIEKEKKEQEKIVAEFNYDEIVRTISSKLKDAATVNEKALLYEQDQELYKQREQLGREIGNLTSSIDNLRGAINTKISDKLSVIPGLEFIDNNVYYNGYASESWSTQESQELSNKLWFIINPKVQTLFIDNGEKYDRKNFKLLCEEAIKNNIQIIFTMVSQEDLGSEENTVYISEGKNYVKE
jgi:hypothetical protein